MWECAVFIIKNEASAKIDMIKMSQIVSMYLEQMFMVKLLSIHTPNKHSLKIIKKEIKNPS